MDSTCSHPGTDAHTVWNDFRTYFKSAVFGLGINWEKSKKEYLGPFIARQKYTRRQMELTQSEVDAEAITVCKAGVNERAILELLIVLHTSLSILLFYVGF